MSKMDGLRAMREAKYAEAAKRAGKPAAAPRMSKPAGSDAAEAPRPKVAPETSAPTETTGQLCGHRNMGGRTCTREHGHAAKSHRYS